MVMSVQSVVFAFQKLDAKQNHKTTIQGINCITQTLERFKDEEYLEPVKIDGWVYVEMIMREWR